MKQSIFCILFFAIICSGCGQENKFTLSGKITDCKTKAPIKGVTIKLVGSDKSVIQTKSDPTGNYYFTNCFKPNTGYVISTQVENNVGRSKPIKYGICPYEDYENYGYLYNSEKVKISTADTNTNQIHDFCLIQLLACGPPPTFYFKKNSIELFNAEWVGYQNTDTAIDCLVTFLMAHKSWVFELSAHSSKDETNKKELAKARAKKFLDLLTSKGIESERFVCQSYADTSPIEFMDDEGKPVKRSIEISNEKSRRVTLSLLRKDYIPK